MPNGADEMSNRPNALLTGAFHLERSLSELLEQNPEVLERREARKLRTAVNTITKLLPSVRELAKARQAQLNADELRAAEQRL